MPDGPEATDGDEPTPDAVSGPDDERSAEERFPAPDPKVRLINDDDLAWVDKPALSDEEVERRQERRDQRRQKVRRKRRLRKGLIIGGSIFGVFLILGVSWFYYAFGGLRQMPSVSAHCGQDTPGSNFLLVGDNPSEPDAKKAPASGYRHAFAASDMVMVLHLTRNADQMYVVSIPADSLLPIATSCTAPTTPGTLREAYAQGGENLYVKTVEAFTGLSMDHVAVLDMAALRELTDQIDGVLIDVPRAQCGLPAGPHRFSGADALNYVAKFPCLPGRDIDRVQHQQALLRALMRGAVDSGGATNPFTMTSMLHATSGSLTLEDNFGSFDILGTLFSMRGLRSTTTTFVTTPISANPFPNGADTIVLDPTKDAELWTAMQQDRMQDYLALHTDIVTQ